MIPNDLNIISPSLGSLDIRVKPVIPSADELNIQPNKDTPYPQIAPTVTPTVEFIPTEQSSSSITPSANKTKEDNIDLDLSKSVVSEQSDVTNSNVESDTTPHAQDTLNIEPNRYYGKATDSNICSIPNVIEPNTESYIFKDNNSIENTFIDKDSTLQGADIIKTDIADTQTGAKVLVIYISGTMSDKDRLTPYPEIVEGYNQVFRQYGIGESDNENVITNYFFDWKTDPQKNLYNGILNDYNDRKVASKKLISEIKRMMKTEKYDKIIAVGHSHGGNIAIQSAEELSELVDNVTLFTIATPANNEYMICYNPDSFVGHFNRELGNNTHISLAEPYMSSLIEKITEYHFSIGNLEINPESAMNFEHRPNIKHFALYSKDDNVDDISYLYENSKTFSGMNNFTECFENNATKNIELPKVTVNYSTKILDAIKKYLADEKYEQELILRISDIITNPDENYKKRIEAAVSETKSNLEHSHDNEVELIECLFELVTRFITGPHSIDLENPKILFDAIRKTDTTKQSNDNKNNEKK